MSEENSCLNCKYEPDWSEPSGGEYPRRTGNCKWNKPIQILPAVYSKPHPKLVVRYSDDSGIHLAAYCKVWEPKS